MRIFRQSNEGASSSGKSVSNNGINLKEHMDTTVSPLDDFYTYAVGTWKRNNPVPSDKSRWGAFEELSQRNTEKLRQILEACSNTPDGGSDEVRTMLGDFYKSAMDTETLEKKRFQPLLDLLGPIEEIDSLDGLMKHVAVLHLNGIFPFFRIYSQTDEKNSSVYALYFYQDGLSLPDRDYYLSESFEETRKSYREHIKKVFAIFGEDGATSEKYADSVISVETGLAKASRSQVDLRDAEKNYNSHKTSSLDEDFPNLKPATYMKQLGVPETDYVVIGQPEFFEFVDSVAFKKPMEEIRAYLRWTVITAAAPFLFSEIEDENFDMFNRIIRGQKEPEPRWKRAVYVVDGYLGEALGKLYVKEHFGQEAKEKMAIMVDDIREVFRERLVNLEWMTSETKQQALVKFDHFTAKIGHPERFRDYSGVSVNSADYFGNICRAGAFEMKRQISRTGKEVDPNEWYMTPPTVNAYFSPPDNEIVFPAGILQPPFFDPDADDAVNYGAIGSVISHEITHGYDDQGRRYDEEGNLREWWTDDDRENFMKRAKKVVDLYSTMEILPGLKVNGELTLGENIADIGGVSIAYEALQKRLEKKPEKRKNISGLTPEQRFFISYGQVWRQNILEPAMKMLATIDPHSPNRFRATLPVYNHPEFEKAFSDHGGEVDESVKREKIHIW